MIHHTPSLQDPESMDSLHDVHMKTQPKKEESTPSPIPFPRPGAKFKPFSTTRQEPSFKSFLMGSSGRGQERSKESPPPNQLATSQSYIPKS